MDRAVASHRHAGDLDRPYVKGAQRRGPCANAGRALPVPTERAAPGSLCRQRRQIIHAKRAIHSPKENFMQAKLAIHSNRPAVCKSYVRQHAVSIRQNGKNAALFRIRRFICDIRAYYINLLYHTFVNKQAKNAKKSPVSAIFSISLNYKRARAYARVRACVRK